MHMQAAARAHKYMIPRLLIAALALSAGACSGLIDEFPTTPDPVITTETFTGTVARGSGQTHQFFTAATGPVTATLTSLGEAPPARIGFAMGTMSPTGSCTLMIVNDSALVNSVLTGTVGSLSGALCIRVYDTGALEQSVDYTFTVSHP
jgi:hypothetical protein